MDGQRARPVGHLSGRWRARQTRGLLSERVENLEERRRPTPSVACLVTEEYDAADPDEHGVPWDDPRIRHLWSTDDQILSERHAAR